MLEWHASVSDGVSLRLKLQLIINILFSIFCYHFSNNNIGNSKGNQHVYKTKKILGVRRVHASKCQRFIIDILLGA